jgi:hypothetical protein
VETKRATNRRGGIKEPNYTEGSKFLPLFLLKETEAFVPHKTREERPLFGFISQIRQKKKKRRKKEEPKAQTKKRKEQKASNPNFAFVPRTQPK